MHDGGVVKIHFSPFNKPGFHVRVPCYGKLGLLVWKNQQSALPQVQQSDANLQMCVQQLPTCARARLLCA